MKIVDLRFLSDRGPYERIDVGSGVAIILWESGEIGFEHLCTGIWQDPDMDLANYWVAPTWPGAVIAKNPLTLSPSLLCVGAAKDCGLHGFVESGVWRAV